MTPRIPGGRDFRLLLAGQTVSNIVTVALALYVTRTTGSATDLGVILAAQTTPFVLLLHIPPQALSRVSSYDWMGSLALLPVGYAVAGPLAAVLGVRTVLGIGSGIGVLAVALALSPRSTRNLGAGPSEP